MRFLPVIIGLGALAYTVPALATSSLVCESPNGATIELAIGTVDASVGNATITIDDKIISMVNGDIVVGQQYVDDGQFLVDLKDPDLQDVVARLRLFRAMDGEYIVFAGTLQVQDTGAYAVTCSEF